MGELSRLNFDDESIEAFGVTRLEDLGWEQLMDAYACIMCYRCQEACPAYNTGKLLSPAALEINKRYFLNFRRGSHRQGRSQRPDTDRVCHTQRSSLGLHRLRRLCGYLPGGQ